MKPRAPCEAPGCGRSFVQHSPTQRACSPRCAALMARFGKHTVPRPPPLRVPPVLPKPPMRRFSTTAYATALAQTRAEVARLAADGRARASRPN